MQRRNFIGNLAVILPAGIVAPNLLIEQTPQYKNLVKTKVLILGAGDAALFIAGKLKKEKIDAVVLEPAGGISDSAVYNHIDRAGVIKQPDLHQNATVSSISEDHYSGTEGIVTTGFIPAEITKTADGFIVSDGEKAYSAEKLIIALPVKVDMDKAVLVIDTAAGNTVKVSCKRNGKKNHTVLQTITAAKIDEQFVMRFAGLNERGILAVL